MMHTKQTVTSGPPESALISMLTQLVTPLIDHPEACSVEVMHLPDSERFIVHVASQDIGKFTGQNERTGRSLCTIVTAVGSKTHRRFSLTFRDNTAVTVAEKERVAGIAGT